ncbi:MAG: FAD-binding oxidoreductase [Bacteroidia bacterium]|nr:FAD-binding oxidoreductase [Bacteroidia bacterium]
MKKTAKRHHPLYDQLAEIVGAKYVSDEEFVLRTYNTYDVSCNPPGKVLGIVVMPGSTDEVVEIVKLANETKTSIVPRGGGASIKGYVAGERGRSINMDMIRMNRIIELDTDSKFVTAEAGIILAELANRVAEKGFYLPTVYMPIHLDTLGGIMSGQEGGGQNIHNNSNWRNVLGFKVVLPDGSVVETGSGPGRNINCKSTFFRTLGGPDITGLFLGDCGTFGIKTEVTMQIFTPLKVCKTGAFVFDTFEDQWQAVSNLMAIEPYLENLFTQLIANDPEGTKMLTGGAAEAWSLFYGARGVNEEEVAPRVKIIEKTIMDAGGKRGSDTLAEVAEGFYVGGTFFDTGGVVSAGMTQWNEVMCPKQDGAKRYMEWRSIMLEEFKKEEVRKFATMPPWGYMLPFDTGRVAFHGTHSMFDDCIPGAREAMYKIEEKYRTFVGERGMFTENTQGRDADAAASFWSPSFRSLMQVLKRAIDPNNIMNPGVWGGLK